MAPPTPRIDALAAQGIAFRQFYVMPSCSPTRASLLTGRYPRRTGIGSVIFTLEDSWSLHPGELTVAEALAAAPAPFRSAAFGKWHLGVSGDPGFLRGPLEHGFGWSKGTLDNLPLTLFPDDRPGDYDHFEYVQNGFLGWHDAYATSVTVGDALAYVAVAPEPWFVYVALHAAHTPLTAPPADLVPSGPVPATQIEPNDWYHPTIEAADTEIGRLLDGLGPGLLARTNVLLLSDNGTPEERILPPYDPTRAKLSLFDGGTRVPLVVSGPAVHTPGVVSDALVSVVDLFPTLLELGGAPMPPVPLDGVSIRPLLDGTATSVRDRVYTERIRPNGDPAVADDDLRSLRDDRWRITASREGDTTLFEYVDGAVDEGPDLLATGVPLTVDQADALARLTAELEAQVEALPFAWTE